MEDKLGTFISSLQANPNIVGLPDSTTLRNVFYDKEKAEVLFKSLKSNPNIMGLPEDYDTFAEGLGLSEQLQRPVMPELPTEEILDKRQKTNTSRSLPIYRGIAGNIPAAIFNKKLDKAVEKGELPEEDAKEIKKITEQNKWGDLGRSLLISVLGAGEMALKTPQGLGGLSADISTRIQFPGMYRQINKAVKEGKMTVEQGNELWKILQSPTFNLKTGQFEQGFIYGENLAESKLTKWFEDNQQKLKEQMTYTDKEIWDYIEEGDIEKAIWATAYGVAESLFPTILAAFTKRGAAFLGLGTGSVTYDEVKDREDMMANKKIIDAVGQGIFEWFFEALFTKQMGDQFKAILKAKGPEGLKAAINSEAIKNLIGKGFKKFGVWFNPVGEGVSELLTTLAQNAVAKYTGEDPTRKISDGAIDAFIVGMGMGGGFSAIEGVAKKFKERPSDGQRTEDPVKPPTDDTTTEKQSTLDDIREQARSEEQRIANEAKEMTREGTDEISFVTLANDSGDIAEKPRYVLKDAINEGKKEVVLLEIDPEGKLTGKKVMKMVSDLDVDKETGKVAMTTVKADEHIAAQINTMRETAQSAMNIMAKELSGLNEGDIFSEDGIRYVIEEVSTDGVAVSRLNEEGYVTGESELWSPDEVKEAMNAPTPADTQQAAPAEKVQQEAPETGTEEVDQPTTPQEQQQAAPVEQTQPQEQEQEQQKVEYPKDKEGNIDYNQITETGTYAEALEQEFGETSVSIVDEFIKNINEDIEKAGKGKDPIKKAREIKKLNDRLAFLDGVRNIIAPVREQELTDKARETTEQLEQVQERPPVQETQVETVVPETKAADTAKPINTRSKRKGWPMSKADQERLIKEPQSFEEAVLQFFLGGGRMSMDDYYTHFGKSREEMRKNIWMYSKKGQRLDALNENSIFASYPHLLRGLDGPMDMENAVFEVIRSHSGKNSIRERLDEIQNKPLEPEVPENIQAEQNTDFEVENSEITGNDVIDEQLLSIFEEYYDNGEIDFSRISEDLENDIGWFTVFPYNLSEQETNELKNILENADKRTKITDRVRNIVEPESGSQRDDTRDRTEEVERGDSGDRIPRVAETEATGTTPDTRGEIVIDEAAIEGTPQKAQIDLLNTEKENLKARRNNLDAEFARRNGLFGDTQADPNDLFGGLQVLDPNAYRQQIKGINDRLAEIDRQTEILYQNALTSLKESQGQQEITSLDQEIASQEPNTQPTEGQKDEIPLSETDNVEGTGEEVSQEEEAEGLEIANKIQDFGEKIGMARKDVAVSGYEMTGKKQGQKQPAWKAKYKVFSQENMATVERIGAFRNRTPLDPNKFTLAIVKGRQFRDLKTNIDTKEEAEQLIPIYEVALNHRVYASSANKEEFSIYRRWSSGKLYEIRKGFKTNEEAMKYMADNAEEIISWKSPKIERPHLDKIERKGVERRKGNATPEMFMETFGLRGGEFGNWVAADERQTMLNFAYDAMADMADVLGIDPKALSLNGRLAIGFGSRGRGLSKAQAHFEAERGVINLTKIYGAGALAHEWFHAFDSYFGMKDKKAFVPDESGVIQAKIDANRDYLSGDYNSNPNIRKEVKEAWKKVWDAMRFKTKMSEYDDTVINRRIDSAMKSIVSGLDYTRGVISRDRSYGLRKKAATPEQLARWDKLVDRIKAHDFGERISLPTKKKYITSVAAYEVQNKLDELYKEITGRGKTDERMYYALRNIQLLDEELKKAKEGEKYESKVATTFYRDSKEIDKSRSSDYWSTNTEMSARAFESYVYDKMVEAGGQNDYLVHSVNNAVYQMIYDAKPYPEGEERTAINKAFDNLFDVLETKQGEDGNVVLYEDKIAYNLENTPENSIFREELKNAYGSEQEQERAIEKTVGIIDEVTLPLHIGGRSGFLFDPGPQGGSRTDGGDTKGAGKIKRRTVRQDFKESGFIDFTGREITSPADLASLYTIHRSPYIEKFHVIFVKDGKIVGTSAITSNVGGYTQAHTTNHIIDLYKKYGADGAYFLHNHPSGNHRISTADVLLTRQREQEMRLYGANLLGHVVIDHEKFSYIRAGMDETDYLHGQAHEPQDYYDYGEVTEMEYPNAVPKLFAERESIIVDGRGDPNKMFQIAKALLSGNGYKGAIIYLSSNLSITGYDVIPQGATMEDAVRIAEEAYKNNIGTRIAFVHDGSIEDNVEYPYVTLDVIDTSDASKLFRRKPKEAIPEVDILWEPQFQVASPITETILELLEKAGIEVVMEKEAYNKAKEELLKANGVELKDGKGKVYGFAYQEKIYLDPDLVNPNTPIHEYTHLWDIALMKMDLELWDKGIDLLKQTPEWNRVVNDPNYANIRHSDDLIASEVHARLVGKDGPTILQEMIDNAKAESPVSHMEALSVVDRIKRWLKQVYVKLFGNKVKNSGDLTLEQWISMPIKDLFEGKRITGEYLEKSPENVKFTDKTEQHGSEGQQREQGTEVPRTPRLGSEQERVHETRRILDELRSIERGEGQDNGGTTSTDQKAEGSERRKLQALATAEVRAKETGAWIDRSELKASINHERKFPSGQESEVYQSKDRKSVIKLNNLSIVPSVTSFLYRIEEHNKIFPDTAYEVIGFSENSEGEFCFVLEQPFIDNTKEASYQQIDDYFREKGWYKIIDGEYTDGEVEIWDVYPKNVLTDEAGNLYFIDVNIDPARERYQKYKLPDVPQMEIRPAKEFVKGGVFDVNGYLNSLPERPNVPVDMLQSKSEKVVEHLQDRGLSLKKLQDLVKEKGNFDPKNMDAYMRENLSHGMAKNAIDTFDKTEKTALLKAMNATGLNYKEINDYLKAKHIPERNAYYKEKSGREISGGLSTEEAIRRAEGYESKIKETLGAEEGTKAINDLWKAVTDITDYTLKKWLEYGYLDREGYDQMKAMYDNYVPLRGFAASEIDQMIDYQEGQMGLGKNVNPLKKAKGRTTEADDPVQYMINMAYSSVVMGEKNRVKQTLARMVRGNPEMDDIFRFQRVYEVWDGTVDEDGNRNYTEVLERPAQELFNNGMVRTKTDNRHKIARTPYQAKAHESVFYIDGKRYVMVLPSDVADFVNKTRTRYDNLVEMLAITKVPQFTRWLSNNFTSKNPAFIPINMIRDLGYSTMSHYVQGGTEQSKIFMGKLPEARRAIIDYLKDKGDPKNPVYSHYLDFMIHGGETGYVHLKNVEDIAVDMNKELKRLQGTNSLLDKATHIRVLRIAGKWLENMAIRSENLARFATYLTAIEMGKSQKEAAYAAKNISVNFNRKGKISSMMGGLFAFFNASVQGGENIIRIAKTNPKPFFGLAGTLMAMGFMEAMLNSMWGDDDEDGITNRYEDGVSNYTKYNNLVILIPGVDTAVTIALPHGFRWFHALGVISYQISQGHLRGGEATREALSNLFSSISPVDAVDFIDSEGGFSARPIIPTVGVPFFDIAVNENYAGFPIKREPFTRAQEGTVAEVTLGQRNVSKWAQKMSDWIFFLGGGDPETGSKMFRKEGKQHRPVPDMFDINPSSTEHVVEYYLGGRGRFWVDTFKTLGAFIDGATDVINGDKLFREMLKDINVNDLPVVRRLVQQPWDNVIMGMYYDEVEAIENYKSFVDLSTKAGAEIKYSPVYTKKIHAMKEAQKKVSDMNARIRQVDDRLTLEKLEEEREGIMRHFLETIKAIENESNRQ